jgi:hypothetical protein
MKRAPKKLSATALQLVRWLDAATARTVRDLAQVRSPHFARALGVVERHKRRVGIEQWRQDLAEKTAMVYLRRQDLVDVLKQYGAAAASGPGRKQELAEALVARLEQSVNIHHGHEDDMAAQGKTYGSKDGDKKKDPVLTVVDVGTTNLAWVNVPMSRQRDSGARLRLEQGALLSIFETHASKLDKKGRPLVVIPARNMANEYAARIRANLLHAGHLSAVTAPQLESADIPAAYPVPHRHFAIELQMQRHNPRCIMVETLLHAFLYPRALNFSPLTVGTYYGILQRRDRLKLDKAVTNGRVPAEEALQVAPTIANPSKKTLAVKLVQHWIDTNQVVDIPPDSPLGTLFREASKRDDLADCILAGVVHHIWMRGIIMNAEKLYN